MSQHPLQGRAVILDGGVEQSPGLAVKKDPAPSRGVCLSSLAHVIGVSVSGTTAETRIVTVRVTANSRNSRPTMSPMKSSGISTAINETVSDRMVKPIYSEPLSAAPSGVSTSSI